MTRETSYDLITLIGLAALFLAVIGYWVAAVLTKRAQRHKDCRVYVHLGEDTSLTLEGYPLKQANAIAREWMRASVPVIRLPGEHNGAR